MNKKKHRTAKRIVKSTVRRKQITGKALGIALACLMVGPMFGALLSTAGATSKTDLCGGTFTTLGGSGNILVYVTEDGNGYYYDKTWFDDNLPAILGDHGYSVTVTDRITTPEITNSLLADYDELWILSTNPYSAGCFSNAEIGTILNFRDAGNGLLIVADHGWPGVDYAVDANQISVPLGVTFHGVEDHGPTGGSIAPDFEDHPLFAGVETIEGSNSEGNMIVNDPAEVVAPYQGDTLIAVLDDGSGKVVFDVSFTRLWDAGLDGDGILVGDTPRYVKNIAGWLMSSGTQPLTCAIELRKQGTTSSINKVSVGEFFDIYVGDSTGDIVKVRFLSDENQNGRVDEGFTWTDWYDWDTSLEDWTGNWDAMQKIKTWSFATPGIKEVWAEVKDTTDQTADRSANIHASLYSVNFDVQNMRGFSDGTITADDIVAFIQEQTPNSPMLSETDIGSRFVNAGLNNNVNPAFLVATARHEGQFGTAGWAATYPEAHNTMGWYVHAEHPTPELGYNAFDSWGDCIERVAERIAAGNGYYYGQRHYTVDQIRIEYAPTQPNSQSIVGIMNELYTFAKNRQPFPVITSPLEIAPEKDTYYVGDTITAEFTITNEGTASITFDVLTVGGRLNDECPNDECPDFSHRSLTLQPNEPYHYEGSLTLTQAGEYHFFCAYYIKNPTPKEKKLLDINNWNTCVGLGEGLTDEDRIKDITVGSPELQLARKFAPILFLADDEFFEPKEIGIMLPCSYLRKDDYILMSRPSVNSLYNLDDDGWKNITGTTSNDLQMSDHRLDIVGYDPLISGPEDYAQPYNIQASFYDNVVYAHIRMERNRVVVQYWFFYFFNYHWAFPDHEGDIEFIELIFPEGLEVQDILDEDISPDLAAYSQHIHNPLKDWTSGGCSASWDEVEKICDYHPVVYVAKGSHANFFSLAEVEVSRIFHEELGTKSYHPGLDYRVRLMPDVAEPSQLPEKVNDSPFKWMAFRGSWGQSGDVRGPTLKREWWEPYSWAESLWHAHGILGLTSSPVHLHVYDLHGNHVGMTGTGEIEATIPGTVLYVYSMEEGPEVVVISTTEDLTFSIEAYDKGEFDFGFIRYLGEMKKITATYENIEITENTTATVDVSSENPEFIMGIDSDDDGSIDEYQGPKQMIMPGLVLVETPQDLPEFVRIAEKFEIRLMNVVPETPFELGIENSKFTRVWIDLKEARENVTMTIEKLEGKPLGLPDPLGLVWTYHRIEVNVPEDAIENAEIDFWVPKEWLTTHGVSKENVRLLRFGEGWEELTTEIVGENTAHVSYRAGTPGFSVFAITAYAPPAEVLPLEINMMLVGALVTVAIALMIAFVVGHRMRGGKRPKRANKVAGLHQKRHLSSNPKHTEEVSEFL